MDLLLVLAGTPGQVLSKDDILGRVWRTEYVSESALTSAMTELRHALQDDAEQPWLIETVPKRGYRLIATVRPVDADDAVSMPPTLVSPEVSAAATSRRVSRRGWLAALVVVLTLGGLFVVWRYSVPAAAPGLAGRARSRSIAVLPLRNLTGEAHHEWFAEALTDELTAALSRIGTLRVISGVSARHYRGSNKTAPEIAQELGADWLLDGRVERTGDHVRISLSVDNVVANQRVWSASYGRPVADSSEILEGVARRVAVQIAGGAPDSSRVVPTTNGAAYESYLRGLWFRDRQMDGGCERAESYFLRAIALDPDFAQPHAAVGYCYGANRLNGTLPLAEGLAKGHAEIARALELDEHLADAHVSLAMIRHRTEYDWAGAERSFKRALASNPGHPEGLVRYGELLYLSGRVEDGLSMLREGLAHVPFSVDYRVILGYAYYNVHRFDEALDQFEQARELDASRPYASWGLAQVFGVQGRHDPAVAAYVDALRLMLVPTRSESAVPVLQRAYEHGGWPEFWREELKLAAEDIERPGTVWQRYARRSAHFEMARRFARLGDHDRALSALDESYQRREGNMVVIGLEPIFDGLRSHPRFQVLVRAVHQGQR
jgi:TolB-like protein/tetratricopeptide (TPR) repeat protein